MIAGEILGLEQVGRAGRVSGRVGTWTSVKSSRSNAEGVAGFKASNKKLLGTSASLLVTSALLVVTRSY